MSHQVNYSFVWRMILIVTAFVAVLVIFRDIAVYRNGGRPWLAIVDSFCGIFCTAKRNTLIAAIPVREKHMSLRVSHPWRGKYQFWLRVPDDGDVSEKLGLKCLFRDQSGNLLFEQEFSPETYASWYPMLQRDGKYRAFWMYSVPQDVPLDIVVAVEICLSGEVDAFLRNHPESELLLVKERDK